ncbi:MAG: DNA translocase FtsK [Verrucomicrobia bacterium]|nr:DNA translocase FtsK [Verrucomicrobiota bacterium]MBI3871245.1 DNA translocase FtsK [Verrucomicrobiota bacterium]
MSSRESASDTSHRGWGDIVGILLIASAVLLFAAQVSFDPADVASNHAGPARLMHNWVGSFGAYLANGFFFLFGLAAFALPFLLSLFGLGCLMQFLSYLKGRWWAGLMLFLAALGLLDLYSGHFKSVSASLNIPSAGGGVGMAMNGAFFKYFGVPGATLLFVVMYAIALLFLTNFRLGAWMRERLERAEQAKQAGLTAEEKQLEKRRKELEREAGRLQDELDRKAKASEKKPAEKAAPSGLGADLQPVPAPLVRDLSVPQARSTKASKSKPVEEAEAPKEEVTEEIITAKEIETAVAGSVEAILGRPFGQKAPEPAAVSKPASTPESKTEPVPANADLSAAPAAPAAAPVDSVTFHDNSFSKPKRAARRPKPIAVASTPLIGNYQLPGMNLLNHPDTSIKPTETKEELMANARLMQGTLAQFDIEVALGDITKGPTITRYELHPAPGVKLEKISALANNIAAALKAERINILAPIPGKSSVGVEVPNSVKTKVIMRDLLESEEWQNSKARLPIALGKDVYGHPIVADLSDMPHMLVAGSTGSGKSVCINAIIASLLYRFSPDQLRFVMIDPKVVELQQYNALPHLVVPVVTDPKKVVLALRWVVNEMEKRYQIFAKVGVRNIKSFNERPKTPPAAKPSEPELPLTAKKERIEVNSEGFAVELDEEIVVPRDEDIVIPEKLSYVVVIIDELADLMLVAPADVEMAIARITQMARAAGIHCIVATQRPSVDVITGVIKANIPARIAFQVASKVDSRTILDAMGADKLLGKGDMLFLPPGSAKLTRVQGVLITDPELQAVVDHIAKQGKPSYELDIHQQLQKPARDLDADSGSGEDEELIEQCVEVIRSEQKASVSLLQRRLKLGYGRAARIMDELEDRGIVGPSRGAEPRDILIDLDGTGADGLSANSQSDIAQ